MRKHLVLAALVILACSPAMAQCFSSPSGVPVSGEDCMGHSTAYCHGSGAPPPGQCCVECIDANGCHFAAFGSCDDGGSGGGGGQCHGSRCTESVVVPTEHPGWFARAWESTKKFLHLK